MSDFGELDEELLALAGDGESDGEGANITEKADDAGKDSPLPSRSPTPVRTTERVPSKSPPRKGVAQKAKKKRGAVRRKLELESEEEEGEASDAPGSPDSAGSAAMDESDSDTAAGEYDNDDVLYPIEGKFKSERDRAEILAMPEIQREEILAERAQELERVTQDKQLRRILQASESKKKRKAGAADLDEDLSRKSTRPKTKANENLESYKRQREQRNQQRRRDEARRTRDRRSSSVHSADSDRDAEGESEPEYDERPVTRTEPPSYRDYDLVRVGRSNFSKVCFYPGFEDAIVGCFVRVSIGQDRNNGQNVYRMAQIRGFAEGKPYSMEGSNKRVLVTDQYVVLAHGKAEKEWPFLACSDSKITDLEFDRWKKALTTDNLREPSKRFLADKLQGIHELLNRQWTNEDIQAKITKQNKYAKFEGPIIGISSSQTSQPKPVAAKSMSQSERLAELNRLNRKANIEEIRKAQIAEKRAETAARVVAREKAERLAREEADKKARESLRVPGDDLFEGGSDISRTGTPLPGDAKKEKKKLEVKGIPTFRKRNIDDDILSSMDFGIEVDI